MTFSASRWKPCLRAKHTWTLFSLPQSTLLLTLQTCHTHHISRPPSINHKLLGIYRTAIKSTHRTSTASLTKLTLLTPNKTASAQSLTSHTVLIALINVRGTTNPLPRRKLPPSPHAHDNNTDTNHPIPLLIRAIKPTNTLCLNSRNPSNGNQTNQQPLPTIPPATTHQRRQQIHHHIKPNLTTLQTNLTLTHPHKLSSFLQDIQSLLHSHIS